MIFLKFLFLYYSLFPNVHSLCQSANTSDSRCRGQERVCKLKNFTADVRNCVGERGKISDITWSPCSASCGEGVERRICKREERHCDVTETRSCFLKYCPSYLTFPRIHFSGHFTADVNTLNNIRCNYVNERFSPASMKEDFPILSKTENGYTVETRSWNPDGSGRFHLSAVVTSFCNESGSCVTDDAIVGKEMKESTTVAMVDIDPDWQLATELYGMEIRIQGMLEAKFETSAIQTPKPRGNYVMAAMKSKLTEIYWLNDDYKKQFKESKNLSISFVMDQFREETRQGRITGTIGLTSDDDPLGTTAVRRMHPTNLWSMKGSAPFHIDDNKKILTLDISSAFNCSAGDGIFNITALGHLDLAVVVEHDGQRDSRLLSNVLYYVTQGGALTKKLGEENRWYDTFGGVMDINLGNVPNDIIELMTSHRMVITQKQPGKNTSHIILSETIGGISLGFTKTFAERMNPDETVERTAFVSSFGRPVFGADLQMSVVSNSEADTDCGWEICNRTLGEPSNALQFSALTPTDHRGVVTFKISARDPGNPRGCGLDGQVFPTELRLRLNGLDYVEGGLLRQRSTTEKNYDYYLATMPSVIVVYNRIEEMQCPTWQDVKEIFIRYHNLYPVMWRNNIIDLSSFADVKRRSKMLRYAMFEVSFDDPRYMPISRDLSRSKANLIKNWMDCGMKERNGPEYPTCNGDELTKRVTELKELLHRAVSLELSIIPPYYTAWLSLQTEYGRNRGVAKILRTVFVEEMLHMSLAANILNAVNGTVDLTTYSNLPFYPTSLAFSEAYKLAPNLLLTLGPLSRGLIQDVFMLVEEPGDFTQRQILKKFTRLLEVIGASTVSSSARQFTSAHRSPTNDNSSESLFSAQTEQPESEYQANSVKFHDKTRTQNRTESPKISSLNWKKINGFTSTSIYELSTTNITSIGAFYTAIALNLAFVESCYQMKENGPNTLFVGNVTHQLNFSHWHRPEDYHLEEEDSEKIEFPIFEVIDLQTALQAIVAIIYEGEGGTNCSPYLKEGEDSVDLPHYHRFMEIVNGRRLRQVREPASWKMSSCLDFDDDCDANNDVTNKTMLCFTGDLVPFHDDGVWPILTNPEESMYEKGSEVKKLNMEFNHLYTRLLKCLETIYGGKPDHVKQCMQEMHYMQIIGKKIVQTPVWKNGVKVGHGTPTWVYERKDNETRGLPTIQSVKEMY